MGERAASVEARGGSKRNLGWTLGLSFMIGVLLIVALIYFGDPWAIAANTRVLDLLIRGGVIQYTDIHNGLIAGIPDLKYYLWSQDPINWQLVWVVLLMYFFYWGLKAVHFHWIARFFGLNRSLGHSARAYYYGLGIGHVLPFKAGHVATVIAIGAEEDSRVQACTAAGVQEVFVVFEIAVFSAIGLALSGWRLWIIQTFWPLVMLLAVYLFVRQSAPRESSSGVWKAKWAAFRVMAHEPSTLVKLVLLGLLAFLVDDITPYLTAQAFSSDNVMLLAPFLVIQAGVVGGYIASRIPLSPGAIGQYEWGFATVLFVSGVGLPEAAAITLLDGVARYGTAMVMFGVATLGYGVKADMPTVLALLASADDSPAWPPGGRPPQTRR